MKRHLLKTTAGKQFLKRSLELWVFSLLVFEMKGDPKFYFEGFHACLLDDPVPRLTSTTTLSFSLQYDLLL